jgi:hypothetical protein
MVGSGEATLLASRETLRKKKKKKPGAGGA